jgi:hypothetical protein
LGNAQDWELLKSRRGGGGGVVVGRDAFFDFEESKVLWKSFGFEQILWKFGFYRFWRSFEEAVIVAFGWVWQRSFSTGRAGEKKELKLIYWQDFEELGKTAHTLKKKKKNMWETAWKFGFKKVLFEKSCYGGKSRQALSSWAKKTNGFGKIWHGLL